MRERRGQRTQDEFAEFLGVSPRTYQEWESGAVPQKAMVAHIVKRLKLTSETPLFLDPDCIPGPRPPTPAEALEVLRRALDASALPLVWRDLVGDFRDLSRDEANDLRRWIEGRREGAKAGHQASDPRATPRKPR